VVFEPGDALFHVGAAFGNYSGAIAYSQHGDLSYQLG